MATEQDGFIIPDNVLEIQRDLESKRKPKEKKPEGDGFVARATKALGEAMAPQPSAQRERGGLRDEAKPYVAGDARVQPKPAAPTGKDASVLDRVDQAKVAPQTMSPEEMQAGSVAPWKQAQDQAQLRYMTQAGAQEAREPGIGARMGLAVNDAESSGLSGVVSGATTLAQTGIGAVRGAADLIGADGVSQFAEDTSNLAGATGKNAGLSLKGNDKLAADIFSSIVVSLPSIAIATTGGPALPALFAQSAMAEYNEGRNAGFDPGESAMRAGIMGAAEAIGERFGLPEQVKLLKSVGKHLPADELSKVFGSMLAKEIPGEQLTSTIQFLADKAGPAALSPDATLEDYLNQAGETLKLTIGQTALMGGGPAAVGIARDTYRKVDGTKPEQTAEQLARSKGFLRPTQIRTETLSRLDDVAATHGIPSKVVEKLKAAADGRPLADLGGWMKRALGNLAQAGAIAPVDDATLSMLDEPAAEPPKPAPAPKPQASPAAAPMRLNAADLLAGNDTASAPAPEPQAVAVEPAPEVAAPAMPDLAAPAEAAAPAPVEGPKINRNWTAFAPESGTLNIPRAQMPQIKAEHRGALVNFLKGQGVTSQADEVPAADLKPTQGEFSPQKVQRAATYPGGDRSILVSSDGFILDGHHQWKARRDEDLPVKVIRLDAPIQDLMRLAHQFPSSFTAKGASRPQGTQDAQPTDNVAATPAVAAGTSDVPAPDVGAGQPNMGLRPDGAEQPGSDTGRPVAGSGNAAVSGSGPAEPAAALTPGGFDSAAWDKARADVISASRAAGNKHLDEIPAYVETMRGKRVYYAHDTKVRGVIRTVDNNGNVYIDWSDKYSADKEMASPVQEGKKTVMRSSLGPRDLKDYVLASQAEASPEPAPATKPDETFAGIHGEGMAEHIAKVKLREFTRTRPDLSWSIAEAEGNPKYKAGRYVVEGRKVDPQGSDAAPVEAEGNRAPSPAAARGLPAAAPAAADEAAGLTPAAEEDYFAQLFGTQAEQDAAQDRFMASEAQRKLDDAKATEQQRADAKRIRDAIGAEKARAKAEYDDWSGRKYKGNKAQVDLRGDGPSNQASMSIGAINEGRRRNAMEALSQELAALEKLSRAIADDAGAAQFIEAMRGMYAKAEQMAASGSALFDTAGAQFQYMLLDDLKFRGPAGKGNVTSNGLSRAVLTAIKPAGAAPAAAPTPAPAPKPARQSRLTPHTDPRLSTDAGRQMLTEAMPDIGWQQVGGLMIRDPRTAVDPNSPDASREGDVVGRTPWVGSDLWRNRPEEGGKITEADAKQAITKAVAGEPLTTRQKRFITYVLDFEQDREAQRQEADPFEQTSNPMLADYWDLDDLDASGYTDLSEDEQTAADAILAEVDRLGLDREAIIEQAAQESDGLTTKEYHAILKRLADQAVAEYRRRTEQVDASPAGEGVGRDGGNAQAPGRPASERADGPEQAVQGEVERFAAGRALTRQQRADVLATLVDVYKSKGAPREMKGLDASGNERYGFVHSPELFEKSDITGAMVRYFVTMPDGKKAHPTELFPDYTQADIDAEMSARESRQRDRRSDVLRATVPAQQFSTVREAVDWWDKRSAASARTASGLPTIYPSTERRPLTDGKKFVLVPEDTSGEMLEAFAEAGWKISRAAQPEPLTLTSETEAEAQAKADREAKALADEQAKKDADRRRAEADAMRDEFTLVGSQRPADVAMAAGQDDLFGAPAEPAQQAEPDGGKATNRPEALIAARKRLSVLESLRKCIA